VASPIAALVAQQPSSPITLRWLAGCWRQAEAGEIVEEVWLRPEAGTLIGISRTMRDDSTRAWEHMVIRSGPAGLVYEATPSGQVSGVFIASMVSDTAVQFENLLHDWPQQIRYSHQGSDSLIVIISGTVRDRVRSIEYHYTRAPCPAQ
jgi:hypothetical protein